MGVMMMTGVGRGTVRDVGVFGRVGLGTHWRGYQVEVARGVGGGEDRAGARRGDGDGGVSAAGGEERGECAGGGVAAVAVPAGGGAIVKAAPTFRPQLVISMRRLERMLVGG